MAKRQSRRSISLSAKVYQELREHCAKHEIPMAAFAELAIRHYIQSPPALNQALIDDTLNKLKRSMGIS